MQNENMQSVYGLLTNIVDLYWLLVESRKEAGSMSIVRLECSCSESVFLIADIQLILFSCAVGVSPMVSLVGLLVLDVV